MSKKHILFIFCAFSGCYMLSAGARAASSQNAQVEIDAQNPHYTNSGNIITKDGYGIWINGLQGFTGRLINEGNILVTGQDGWGVYETPYQTRPVRMDVLNKGKIQRIQLEQVDNNADNLLKDIMQQDTIAWKDIRPGMFDSIVFYSDRPNGISYLFDNATEGVVEGAALFGSNFTVKNSGTFQNFHLDDSSLTKGNLLSFNFNGAFLNGIDWFFEYDDAGEMVGIREIVFEKNAKVSTDKIQFARQGMFINGATVSNKSFVFGDEGYLYNVGNFYNQENIGGADEDGSFITTGSIIMGNNSLLFNEMGTYLTADSLKMGSDASVVVGGDYSMVIEEGETESTDEDGNQEITAVSMPVLPHSSSMKIKNASLGNNSSLSVLHNSSYEGETLFLGQNNTLSVTGGSVDLTNASGSGLLSVADNSSIAANGFVQEEITIPAETDEEGNELTEEIVVPEKYIDSVITADTLKAGDNVNMVLTSEIKPDESGNYIIEKAQGKVDTKKSIFGNAAYIEIDGYSHWNAEESISLGNDAVVMNSGSDFKLLTDDGLTVIESGITSPLIVFGDNGMFGNSGAVHGKDVVMGNNGTLINQGLFDVSGTLTMHDNSYVENHRVIVAATFLGNNSTAALVSSGENNFNYNRGERAASFLQGIKRLDEAQGVNIINQTGWEEMDGKISFNAGYITGGVDVDSILIDTGELQMSGDIKGVIGINTDAQFRLVDTDVYIHDPISKTQDATNTKLIVDLDGDDHFYKTANTINVDHIYLAGGGFEINNTVQAEDILLDSNTTVRLNGNYYVGDIIEKNEDAANTTLDVNAGKGNAISSTGEIKVDRVVVESGTFNINHTMEAVYKSADSVMPLANESGLELNTDTTANINSDNVLVSRIIRAQLPVAEGQKVTNTTVNVNGGKMRVERNVDVDRLNINGGFFEFQNKDTDNVINIGKNLSVNYGGSLAGAGMMNLREGSLDVNDGGRLSVSTELVENKPVSVMEVIQSEKVWSDADDVTDKGRAVVNLHKGSILDLRADGGKNDKIVVSGEVNIDDGARVIMRQIEAGKEYELIKADSLNGNLDEIRTSFLWVDTKFNNKNNALTMQISGVQTLQEGIAAARRSVNVDNIAGALDAINNRVAANTIDPFLDNIFYAQTAEETIGIMEDYSPEGYLNLPQAGLRISRVFRQSAATELDDMRTYRDVENNFDTSTFSRSYNPNYYGRPGYEAAYANWTNQRASRRNRTRSDKGGIWARPFMATMQQDNNKNISGYKFSSYGLSAGIDKRFGSLALGLMGLYADGSMDQKNKVIESDIKTYGAGVYGYYRPYKSRSFINLYALWTESSNSSKHKVNSLVESAKADFNMTTYSLGTDWGVDIPVSRSLIITPKIGLDYTKVSLDAFEESGRGRAKLKMTANDYTSIQTPLEVRAAFNYGSAFNRFKPELHARWAHEFGDKKTTGQGLFVNYNQAFGAEGVSVAADTFTLGGSLLWLYTVSEVELKYDYDFSSTSTGHTINASYKYMF